MTKSLNEKVAQQRAFLYNGFVVAVRPRGRGLIFFCRGEITYDRDGYTDAKTDFIKCHTAMAKVLYGQRYL